MINPNHNTILATRKKINSIPAQSRATTKQHGMHRVSTGSSPSNGLITESDRVICECSECGLQERSTQKYFPFKGPAHVPFITTDLHYSLSYTVMFPVELCSVLLNTKGLQWTFDASTADLKIVLLNVCDSIEHEIDAFSPINYRLRFFSSA